MVKVRYPARIIADESFIHWLIERDKLSFLKLTHIKSSSSEHKRVHNIMIEEDIQTMVETKKIKESNLRAAFKGIEIPKFIAPKNKNDKILILAITLATESPFKTYIFTTTDNFKTYNSSSHYKGVKSISLKTEEDALTIINSFWELFTSERSCSHL